LIIKSKSPFFEGLINFGRDSQIVDDAGAQSSGERTFAIEQFSHKSFGTLINYFYTGRCSVDSNDLIEMLEMCQEYLLPDLKQLLEQIIVTNIDHDNFPDTL
jgi:hypothetical protein